MPKIITKHRKKIKVLFWIGIIWLIVSILFAWFLSLKLKPIVQNQLSEVLKKATNQLYHIDFNKVYINPLTGYASLSEVKIQADTSVYNKLIQHEKAPNNLYQIRLNTLSIKHFHPLRLFFTKRLMIEELLFDKAHITMINKILDFNKEKNALPDESPYTYIKPFLKDLNIKKISFNNSAFKYINKNTDTIKIDTVANITIKLSDWLLNPQSVKDSTRFFLLKDAYIYVNNYRFATPDSMYYLKTSQFEYTASTQNLQLKEFTLEPRYSEKEFSKANGYARDRFSILLNNLNLKGVSLVSYLRKGELKADTLNISDGSLSVYNDNIYPKKIEDKTGNFPHQLLQKINIPLSIKQINVQNLNISYAEYNIRSQQRGYINFTNTSGIIQNVTNEEKQKEINPIITADLQSYLMEQGKLNVQFKFDMLASKADFSYKGKLQKMDGKQLNYITRPLALVHVKNCVIDHLAFDIKANEDKAVGSFEFRYHNLAVGLLRMNDSQENLQRQSLLSLLTNAVIIKGNNPDNDGKITTTEINYQRNPNASFFNFIWRSLFMGVKHTIGFSEQREKEIKKYIKQFNGLKE